MFAIYERMSRRTRNFRLAGSRLVPSFSAHSFFLCSAKHPGSERWD